MDGKTNNKKLNNSSNNSVQEKSSNKEVTFSNGFGKVKVITTQEDVPVYATVELCMYFWET